MLGVFGRPPAAGAAVCPVRDSEFLAWRYLASRRLPHPGNGHLDVMPEVKQNDYRGEDGERWIYLMAECTNDRQYQIEIYTMGDVGDKVWGKTIDKFIKGFKPQKK